MLRLLRVAILLTTPVLFWLGWLIAPELIGAANMRYLGALLVGVWGLAFHFLRKSADLSSLPGLSGREQQRVVWKLAEIRRRVWWIGGISIISGFLIWLIGSIPGLSGSAVAPLSIGLLVGVGDYAGWSTGKRNRRSRSCPTQPPKNRSHATDEKKTAGSGSSAFSPGDQSRIADEQRRRHSAARWRDCQTY